MIAIVLAAAIAASPLAQAGLDQAAAVPSAAPIAFDGPPTSDEVDAILRAPQSVDPISYVFVAQELWRRGDREQAAFWFYLFQSRTRAWARSDETYAQARGALNVVMGQTINEWAGSDMQAYLALAKRAISYERTFPFYAERPDGLKPAQWNALMLSERAAYAAEFAELEKQLQSRNAEWQKARRDNGLYVGPWQSRGTPLPEHWR